ncbi:DUF1844 domain-containing protein, partial [bacterium]|nr:DUF1844 domain-containing protein [bacterium]
MNNNIQPNIYLVNLVISLSQTGMLQLGKIVNPMTGKEEKNLEQAKVTIGMLEMLKEKTAGNLTKEEEKMMAEVVSNLQLNYVDEVNKATTKTEEKEVQKEKGSSSQEQEKDQKGDSFPKK